MGTPHYGSSDTRRLKHIGASTEFGERASYISAKDGSFDYLFPGEIVTSHSNETSGSSAVTAFASGLAALILWYAEACRVEETQARKTNSPEDFNFQKDGRMNIFFDALKRTKTSFVDVAGRMTVRGSCLVFARVKFLMSSIKTRRDREGTGDSTSSSSNDTITHRR